MRAAFIERFGPPGDIRVADLPVPVPGPADVLVRVALGTVNPVDTFVRSGLYQTPVAFPLVLGRDLVGRVEQAGPGARALGFAPGEPVWCNSLGHGGRQGAAAEFAVVPADRLYRLPAGVDPVDLIAAVHPGATAQLALFAHGGLRFGQTVLVAGGAGNVGAAVVALAAEAGGRVIATASASDLDHCKALGAQEALDYRDPELSARIRQAAPHGVDLYLDTSGRNDLEAAVDLLAYRGRIVLLAGAAARPVLPAGALYMKDGSIAGFVISRAGAAELADAARDLNRLLGAGALRPRSIERRPLDEIADVHRAIEAGELHGRRVVLDIAPL